MQHGMHAHRPWYGSTATSQSRGLRRSRCQPLASAAQSGRAGTLCENLRALQASHPKLCGTGRAKGSKRSHTDATACLASANDVIEQKGQEQQGDLTRRMFKRMNDAETTKQAGGAGGGTTYEALQGADALWSKLRNAKTGSDAGPPPEFVREHAGKLLPNGDPEFDVVVAGGTLGIFLAAALQLAGLSVAVIERGQLVGRAQEWNISRKEIAELVSVGVLTEGEAEDIISIEFNPIRCGFRGSPDVWVEDVLNLGVSPVKAIELVRRRFEAAGGKVFERCAASGVEIHSNGILLPWSSSPKKGNAATTTTSGSTTGRLLLDCMGHFSPIVRQTRWGNKPDGVCCVVGACNRGFDPLTNTSGDLIYTNMPLRGKSNTDVQYAQYFWEAFPAGSGPRDRTTYMFSYLDADPMRPSLVSLMDDYWKLMPSYQGVEIDDLEPQRILFGFFPTYRASPLTPGWDRILQVGDASGIQSPLSFGGFGALTRHLHRLQSAIKEAIEVDAIDKSSLASINSYNPGLSGAWMLQRAMSVRVGQDPNPDFINILLGTNFGAMQRLGRSVLYPFLQDVPQIGPLAATMFGQMIADPLFVPQILKHVGPVAFFDWFVHFIGLGVYTVLNGLAPPLRLVAKRLPGRQSYALNRQLDSWKYGSGQDYKL